MSTKYKRKTKSSAKKRFKITATGKVMITQANKRHNMRKRSKRQLREHRGIVTAAPCVAKIIKKYFFG